ncbi:MAG: Hpt domain-containing protein [Clostridiales bacterium]|jgi:HPt (histidine-containing phosphotransfer) domain-containing protein|nr:Hpt domain-containing protein [Clostridiales bacterium]
MDNEQILRRREFAKGQKYTIRDLRKEIFANHLATAHRLSHTLKGLAGLIGEETLCAISIRVEQQLRNSKIPPESDLEVLEAELNRIIKEITDSGILHEEIATASLTIEEQTEIFDKLETLLKDNDASCIELIPDVSLIPETKVLVNQIENFAFKPALVTLNVLRKVLGA